MTVIQMSERELTRLRVLIDLSDKRLTVEAAASLMGLERRQVYRLRCAFAFDGPAALVSRKRGRASNHRHGDAFRRAVLALVRAHDADFGPTLAAEKLAALHGLRLGVETLRRWMIVEGIWKDRRHRLPSPHQPRHRRDCLGELVQIDGSEHAWFEDRGGMCTLLAFVDDATSRLMALRFVVSESAFDYFRATRAYLEAHGKPVAFYSDKHNIFRVNNGEGGDRVTQFGRALESLNIDIICANTPQAKGRVERAFGTLQDRLVKELRLAEIATIEAANAWLPGFVASYNARFGRQPANAKDLHRPLTPADDLDEILAWREERTVTQNLTLHYDRMMLLLDPTPLARGLVRKKVEVVNYPDGRFSVQFNGTTLGFKLFDKIQTVQPGAIVDNKRLSAVLAQVKAQQAAYPARQQRGHAARQRPPNNLEAPGLPSKGRPPRRAAAAAPS
jgi:Winged helix-turn helix